ncbi:MAG: sigma-70 family RNA polymerase sigma factor [Pirellulaceae bacterium]
MNCSSDNVQATAPADRRALDSALAKRILHRDEAALVRVMQDYGKQIQSLCEFILKDSLDADSVASDVFFEFWSKIEKYQPERSSIRCYLMTLARSRSIDRIRSRQSKSRKLQIELEKEALEMASSHASSSDLLDAAERDSTLMTALSTLPANARKTIHLAFFNGLSHREIAEVSQLPLGTVKTCIRSGLIKLRQILPGDFA